MPLPLLMIPAAAATATATTTTTTSTGVIFAGAAMLTAAGTGVWRFFFRNRTPELNPEHQDDDFIPMNEEPADIPSVNSAVEAVIVTMQQTTASEEKSVQTLEKTLSTIATTCSEFTKAVQQVHQETGAIQGAIRESQEVALQCDTGIVELQKLNTDLAEKKQSLIQVNQRISELTQIVGSLENTITELKAMLQTSTKTNEKLIKKLKNQTKQLHQLKRELTECHKTRDFFVQQLEKNTKENKPSQALQDRETQCDAIVAPTLSPDENHRLQQQVAELQNANGALKIELEKQKPAVKILKELLVDRNQSLMFFAQQQPANEKQKQLQQCARMTLS